MAGKCVEGDSQGPRYQHCDFYEYSLCSGDSCITYESCEDCIVDPFCGWCKNEEMNINHCFERGPEFKGCP